MDAMKKKTVTAAALVALGLLALIAGSTTSAPLLTVFGIFFLALAPVALIAGVIQSARQSSSS